MWRFALGFVTGAAAMFAALDWMGRRDEALFGTEEEGRPENEFFGQRPRQLARGAG